MKKKQESYAIVRKTSYRYQNDLRCPIMEGQLPIYWSKKVAKSELISYGIAGEYEVIKVVLREP